MKLSLIIPVYNVRQYLDECLRSVLRQGVEDLEVILVDDGSTDGSGTMCDAWAADKAFASVIHQKNGGLSAARNTGLAHASGDVIAFLDSDDRLGDNTLRDNMLLFSSMPRVDMIEFPVREYEGSEREQLLNFDHKMVESNGDKGSQRLYVFAKWIESEGYRHCYVWNKLYRASLWRNRRFPVGQVFEDTAVMPDIIRECRAVFYSAKGCYHYLARKGSISNSWHYADCRQLFLNNFTLYNQAAAISSIRRKIRPLRRLCLDRLVDMGRCRDCNPKDYQKQLSRVRSIERFIIKLRVLRAPKL